MNEITIVITMAGMGSRFRDAGYSVPKYQIEAHGKTLFDWSLISLEGYKGSASKYFFIVRAQDDAREFISSRCAALGIYGFQIIEIESLTDGQATTAMLAAPFWDFGSGLLVYNIDTYIEPGLINAAQLAGDGFIPCFEGEGNHWSFVRIGEDGKAAEVREKERISNHCTLGAYYFRTCGLYEELYNEYYGGPDGTRLSEKYIAPMYNLLIAKGGEVYICGVDKKSVHVLGTPEELDRFLSIPYEPRF